jgi:hypothetical protein
MAVEADKKLLEACSDVVIRFKGHGSYKTESGAVKALSRRAPGHTPEQYRACFGLLCGVYDRAVSAIGRHRARRPGKRSRFAEPEDIDASACLAELEEIEPGVAARQKEEILGWVIYWHHLR